MSSTPSPPLDAHARGRAQRVPRVRALVHRGVVEASAILVHRALAGPLDARRRAVAAWRPGVTVHRLGADLLVRFPAPRWIDCSRAPGLPLVRTSASPQAPLASAPLAADELEALAPPPGSLVIVHGGVPTCSVPPGDAAEDPAAYLDISGFALLPVAPLGPAPPPPRVVVEPPAVPPRTLLGIGEGPAAQRAAVIEALRAARAGTAPPPDPQERRLSFFAALLATLAALVQRIFRTGGAAPGGTRAPGSGSGGTGGGKETGLVVTSSAGPERPSVFQRFGAALRHLFASALVRANLAPFLGRRQAEYLGKMLDLFDEGDLSEALRHAIPLAGDSEEGGAAPPPMIGVPRPREHLSISGGKSGGTAPAIFAPDDFYADLRRRYRAAFERLEREGRIEEAAFVLAELLRESLEAVAFLERHGRFRLAAEIAEARGLPPALVVRQWILAGNVARAVLLARRHGAFAEALTRLAGHPQAQVLRMLWAETLADAGDFAAAVELAWPIPEARPTAEVWIDAAIAQGGAAAARMLAKKLALVPGAFPGVRERALILLDDTTGSPRERRALAEGLLAEAASPAARTLARPLVRALVRDGGRAGEPAARLLVERLESFAGDDALRADRPTWPTLERTPLDQLPAPRSISIAAADSGATPVLDAAHLPDGRTVLALGEAGVRVLGRSGRPLFDLGEPAHRLVISDRGDRALALARRGDTWRVARLDLVGRRTEVWCEARFDCTAADFDGSQWVVAEGRRLLVIDALEKRFEALASFDLGEGVSRVHAIARAASLCVAAVEEPGALLSRRRWDLPSWTLRQRGPVETARRPTPSRSVFAAGAHGEVSILTRPLDDERGPVEAARSPLVLCSRDGGQALEAVLTVPASTAQPVALQVTSGWVAGAFASTGGVDLRLHDTSAMRMRVQMLVAGARSASVRLAADALTFADDRGRVLVLDLAHGGLTLDARV